MTTKKVPQRRNSLAGTSTGKSKSAIYFRTHPEARAKKNAANTKRQAALSTAPRVALNKANRDSPNKKGYDKSHKKSGRVVNERQSTNRARQGKGGKPKRV